MIHSLTDIYRIFRSCSTAVDESWLFRQIFCFLVLAATATFCTLPLLLLDSLPQSQDMFFHIFQADQFIQNLDNGVLYPRWAAGAINGYGSPNFIFYSPLSYYLVALVHLFLPSLVSSMVAAIWFGFLLSGVAMFLLVNHFFQGYRGLIPAILYQILPFHMYDVYLRGSFAALFAYIWFPLILLLLFKMLDARRPALYMFCLSLAYAALIMTHLASAYMFSLTAGAFLLYFFFKRQISSVVKAACAFGAGLGLSSIYFIPVLLERKYVRMDYLINGPWGKYVDNYLFTADKLHLDNSQFSHFYMLLHLGVIADLVLFSAILLSMRMRNDNPQKLTHTMFISLFLLSFFLTISLSRPLADILPGLSTLLFPWRWVAIMEVALAFLSGYIFIWEGKRRISSTFFLAFIALSAGIIGTSSFFPANAVAKFKNSGQFSYKMSPGVENIPVWAHKWLYLHNDLTPKPVSFAAGEGNCNVELWAPQERIFDCASSAPSRVRIATFYYPGWEASLDGKNLLPDLEKNSGAILLDIPEGEHVVRLRFVNTPLRSIAQWTSVISLFLLIILASALRNKEF